MRANTAALLRQSFADDPAEVAGALQRVVDGHDVIAESAERQAFRAFATVIATPSQRSPLESDIGEITDRIEGLPTHLREALGRIHRRDVAASTGSRGRAGDGISVDQQLRPRRRRPALPQHAYPRRRGADCRGGGVRAAHTADATSGSWWR